MGFYQHRRYRLPYHNYASNNSFCVTICSHAQEHIFGSVINGRVELSVIGEMVNGCWQRIPEVADYAAIDDYVIMPNHLHGIVTIDNPNEPTVVEQSAFGIRRRSLSAVIRNFKSAVTTRVRKSMGEPSRIVWQDRFYE